jgi:hypothetical protein
MAMSDDTDPAVVLAKLAALSRERQTHALIADLTWPDSLFARIQECEQLADRTIYPEMAAMMHKLVRLWRELASSLPAASGEYTAANDR